MKGPTRSPIKWKVRLYLSYLATFLEISLAILLALALAICILQMIPSILQLRVTVNSIDVFHNYLEALFVLVIGVEALKLLCKHTPGSALEILLFTIAREMIVSHTTPEQNLLVVLSIAIIFAIRKFMYVPAWGSEEEVSAFDEIRVRFAESQRKKVRCKNIQQAQERKEQQAAEAAEAAALKSEADARMNIVNQPKP